MPTAQNIYAVTLRSLFRWQYLDRQRTSSCFSSQDMHNPTGTSSEGSHIYTQNLFSGHSLHSCSSRGGSFHHVGLVTSVFFAEMPLWTSMRDSALLGSISIRRFGMWRNPCQPFRTNVSIVLFTPCILPGVIAQSAQTNDRKAADELLTYRHGRKPETAA